MKSLAELSAIRENMKEKVVLREGTGETRIVVGMATCGIAAGARPVLNAFVEGVSKAGLTDKVTVTQTGCIGVCQYEPVVEIFEAGKEKVTYVKMILRVNTLMDAVYVPVRMNMLSLYMAGYT